MLFIIRSAVGVNAEVFVLATDHLVTVVLLRQHAKRRFNDSTTKTQHEMQCRL